MANLASQRLDLFHAPGNDSDAYATLHEHPRRTLSLRSKGMRRWLGQLYHDVNQIAVSGEALRAAINTLEGKALFHGPACEVHVRLAGVNGTIYLDRGDENWSCIAISPSGWKLCNDAAVKFRHPRGMLELPEPKRGGSVNELRPFLNISDEAEWQLVIGWLLAALRPTGPYPILCFAGEQGSAKSTAARVFRALVDPNVAPLRTESHSGRDLVITASNSRVIAFDNLSYIPAWLSDALCRLATGGGFGTRELYSDGDEMIFDAMRPVILTSIEDVATHADLLDRCIIVRLQTINDDRRRREDEFWSAFEKVRPRILGTLLDVVAAGLRNLPKVNLPRLPRMTDFAAWVTACEPALGWKPGSFLKTYSHNMRDTNELALEASPLTEPLRALLCENSEWTGSASELLAELLKRTNDETARSKEWPKRPHVLSGRLRRVAPNLRKAGIGIEFDRNTDKDRKRTIRLKRIGASKASEASSPAENPAKNPYTSDAPDGLDGSDASVGGKENEHEDVERF